MDEPRLGRARAADARDVLDRLAGPGEPEEQTYVGRVIDGGHYPTYVPAVHLTTPISLAADQEKGKPMRATPDPSRSVLAVSLNRIACPGDILVCRRVGAMWVAMYGRDHDCCVCPIPEGPMEGYVKFRDVPPSASGTGWWIGPLPVATMTTTLGRAPWEVSIGALAGEVSQTMLPFGPIPTGKPGGPMLYQWQGDGEVPLVTKRYVLHTPYLPPPALQPPYVDKPRHYQYRLTGQLYATAYRIPRNPPNSTGSCLSVTIGVGVRGYIKDVDINYERLLQVNEPTGGLPPGNRFARAYSGKAVEVADAYAFRQGAALPIGECDPFLWTDPPFTDYLKDPSV